MKYPNLKIEKTEAADVTWGDYGASRPQGPGDWRYNTPAVYRVTGPTGRTYSVSGTATAWMQRPNWFYDSATEHKGGFRTRAACLNAIAKLETATQ